MVPIEKYGTSPFHLLNVTIQDSLPAIVIFEQTKRGKMDIIKVKKLEDLRKKRDDLVGKFGGMINDMVDQKLRNAKNGFKTFFESSSFSINEKTCIMRECSCQPVITKGLDNFREDFLSVK